MTTITQQIDLVAARYHVIVCVILLGLNSCHPIRSHKSGSALTTKSRPESHGEMQYLSAIHSCSSGGISSRHLEAARSLLRLNLKKSGFRQYISTIHSYSLEGVSSPDKASSATRAVACRAATSSRRALLLRKASLLSLCSPFTICS